MKKILAFVSLFNILSISAQEKFEYGYYIDEMGNRKDGEISEIKPEQIPSQVYFRDHGKIDLVNLETVKEVKYGSFIFRKRTFVFDPSAVSDINEMSSDPVFKGVEKVGFLQLLADGNYQLYRYINRGSSVFLYETNNENIRVLEYKKYLTSQRSVRENKTFQLQLEQDLENQKYSKVKSYSALKYNTEDLVEYFTSLNGKSSKDEGKSKVVFNVFTGYSIHSFDIDFIKDLDTKTYGHITIMPEVEYILNKNKRNPFSFYFNLKYHAFKKKYDVEHESGIWHHEVDYASIFTSVGAKKYFLSNEDVAFYGKLGISVNTPVKGDVQSPERAKSIQFMRVDVGSVGFNSGIGMKFYKRMLVELDYDYSFNTMYTKNNSSLNFKVGYSF